MIPPGQADLLGLVAAESVHPGAGYLEAQA